MKMKKIALSIAAAVSIVGSAAALAGELPTYQVNGFPVSPVQVQLLGAANAQENVQGQAASAIAASPHQLSVLGPRKLNTAEAGPLTTGAAR